MVGNVAQNRYKIGKSSVQAAINDEAVDKRIDTGSTMVTKDNAAAYKARLERQLWQS